MASTAEVTPTSPEASAVLVPSEDSRRCFICLMDEDEAGSSASEWVNPCPCTLEAHQDCIMDWVTNLESEGKEIKCPICKAPIQVSGPWDPAIALGDKLHNGLSRISPYVIAGSLATGTWIGLASYGNFAVRVFAGPEATYKFFFSGTGTVGGVPRFNWVHVATLPLIAPALIVGQAFPILGNVLFMPGAALYGVFHMARDDYFLTWPPSPQLAVAIFPYMRAIYQNLYHEFVCPYEKRLERRILGLADPDPEPEQAAPREPDRNAAANGAGNGDGFLAGMLDAAIRFLDIPDVDAEFHVEVVVEEGDEDGAGLEIVLDELEDLDDEVNDDLHEIQQNIELDLPAPGIRAEGQEPAALGVQVQIPENQPAQQEAPAVVNGRRVRHPSLRDTTNAIASAMLLPVFSAGMGELLRLALPKSWTTPVQFGRFRVRTGLLQEPWGRSLVGGCMYIVLRDAFRLYTKYRTAVNKPLRKVKNVDRRRNKTS